MKRLIHLAKNLPESKDTNEPPQVIRYLGPILNCGEPAAQHLGLALRLGRIEILEEFMRQISFGIYYDEYDEPDEEVRKQHAQKYYQGLNVRGGKKRDWVNYASPANSSNFSDTLVKPMYVAAHSACMASLECSLPNVHGNF